MLEIILRYFRRLNKFEEPVVDQVKGRGNMRNCKVCGRFLNRNGLCSSEFITKKGWRHGS